MPTPPGAATSRRGRCPLRFDHGAWMGRTSAEFACPSRSTPARATAAEQVQIIPRGLSKHPQRWHGTLWRSFAAPCGVHVRIQLELVRRPNR